MKVTYYLKETLSILLILSFAFVSSQKLEYLAIYDNHIGVDNVDLYNGKSYIPQILTVKNNHLFLNSNFDNGQILYKKQWYTTSLKYDIFNDIIIVQNPKQEKNFSFSITSELVDKFNFENRNFEKLPKNKVLLPFYKNGFFENIFQSDLVTFYVKQTKRKVKSVKYNIVRYQFIKKEIYLLKVNKSFYKIHKKRDIIKALPFLKKEIKSFFKDNKKVNTISLVQFLRKMNHKNYANKTN